MNLHSTAQHALSVAGATAQAVQSDVGLLVLSWYSVAPQEAEKKAAAARKRQRKDKEGKAANAKPKRAKVCTPSPPPFYALNPFLHSSQTKRIAKGFSKAAGN